MAKITLWSEDFSPRKPLSACLWPEYLFQIFYYKKIFFRSSGTRRLFYVLLWQEDFYQAVRRSFQVLFDMKTVFRSSMTKRTYSGLLWPDDFYQVFCDLLQVFNGICRSSNTIRLFTFFYVLQAYFVSFSSRIYLPGLLWKYVQLLVFIGWKYCLQVFYKKNIIYRVSAENIIFASLQ